MKIWKDVEVKNLFCEVEKCRNEKMPLKKAFLSHATKFGRRQNSVRNYYYAEIENLKNDMERTKKLQIDLALHTKNHFEGFDKIQENELFEKIENCVSRGQSVRSACLKLSNGNLTMMTRYQNKFQNMKKKVENKGKIIPFQQRKTLLTDDDINSLFAGLVKLVKKSAIEEIYTKFNMDIEKLKRENLELREKLSLFENDKKKALENHLSKNIVKHRIEN